MILRHLIAFFLVTGSTFSEEFSTFFASAEETPISEGIQGIFITGNESDIISTGRPTKTGIQMMDIEIPGGGEELIEILQPYLGKEVTEDNVIEIKQTIMTYYVSNGVSTLTVEVPAQKTKGGVIQFLVHRMNFGKPVYKGQIWYNDAQLNRYLGVTPGQDIVEENLQNNLSWLNKNPFHYSTIKFIPGDSSNVVDIEVTSQSRFPIRIYERADDTGSQSTGYGRFSTGAIWGNAFWMGDLLSFEYQFSNLFKRLQQYTVNYTSFLPWQHIFTLFGSYAIVKPFNIKPTVSSEGKAAQLRPRYIIPFKPFYTPLQQSFMFGFDLKNSNSSIINLSGGSVIVQPSPLPPVVSDINVFQLVADYNLSDTVGKHSLSFDLSFFASPIEFLPNQSNTAYNKQSPHSKWRYCYFNGTLGDIITFPKYVSLSLLLRGQIASHTLPGTELFSLGGFDTVRGYHESEFATDNGFIGNIELRTLPFSLFRKINDQLLFLAFLDFGVGRNWFVPPGVKNSKGVPPPKTQYLLGVGPGLRYTINPYLQLRCDYGFKLHQLYIQDSSQNKLLLGFGQFHVGLLASF